MQNTRDALLMFSLVHIRPLSLGLGLLFSFLPLSCSSFVPVTDNKNCRFHKIYINIPRFFVYFQSDFDLGFLLSMTYIVRIRERERKEREQRGDEKQELERERKKRDRTKKRDEKGKRNNPLHFARSFFCSIILLTPFLFSFLSSSDPYHKIYTSIPKTLVYLQSRSILEFLLSLLSLLCLPFVSGFLLSTSSISFHFLSSCSFLLRICLFFLYPSFSFLHPFLVAGFFLFIFLRMLQIIRTVEPNLRNFYCLYSLPFLVSVRFLLHVLLPLHYMCRK